MRRVCTTLRTGPHADRTGWTAGTLMGGVRLKESTERGETKPR
jgi:hypothetical protein